MDCSLPLLCPWDSPDKHTGVGCHSLLQGIFQPKDRTQVSCIADRFSTVWATLTRQGPKVLTPAPSAQPRCFYSMMTAPCYYGVAPHFGLPTKVQNGKQKSPQLSWWLFCEISPWCLCLTSCLSRLAPLHLLWVPGQEVEALQVFYNRNFSDILFWFSLPHSLQ